MTMYNIMIFKFNLKNTLNIIYNEWVSKEWHDVNFFKKFTFNTSNWNINPNCTIRSIHGRTIRTIQHSTWGGLRQGEMWGDRRAEALLSGSFWVGHRSPNLLMHNLFFPLSPQTDADRRVFQTVHFIGCRPRPEVGGQLTGCTPCDANAIFFKRKFRQTI